MRQPSISDGRGRQQTRPAPGDPPDATPGHRRAAERGRRSLTGRLRALTAAGFAALASLAVTGAPPAVATPSLPLVPWSIDNVVLTEPQVDFGSGSSLDLWGNPLPGHLLWLSSDGQEWWPLLDGRLFINNAAGLCARMQLAYYDSAGRLITTRNGGTVCSSSNRLHVWSVSLMPYGSRDIDQVEVRLQTVGATGTATTVDTFGPLRP